MDTSIPALVAVSFTLILAGLVAALIFSREFRKALLGSPGEASVLNLVSVKGVAIVLLCGLLVGGLLFALNKLPATAQAGPITMRLNVHFQPDDVNPRNAQFSAKAFLKTAKGVAPVPIVHTVSQGALSVQVELPDMQTPFFIIFQTPSGTWRTDDHSIRETATTARKQD